MGAFNRFLQVFGIGRDAPEVVEKTGQDTLHYEGEGVMQGTGGLKGAMVGEVWPRTDVPAATAARVYTVVPAVYTVINKKASMVSSAPINLYRTDTRTGENVVATTGILGKAWQNPNPFLTPSRLVWEIVAWLEIAGRSYLRLEPGPNGEYFFSVLESSNVHVVTDPIKKVKAYVYQIGAVKQFIPMEEIAEFSAFNPTDYWFGLTPMAPISRDVEVERNVKKWLQAQFARGNMKGGMLQSEKKIDDQEILKLKAEWKNRKADSSRVMFLPKEMTFVPFSEGKGESPVKDILNEEFDVVCLAFGLHPILFGHSNIARPESVDLIETWVWNSELQPLLTYIGEVLTAKFSYLAGSNFFFRADTTQILALRRNDMDCTRVGVAQVSTGKRTINEWRKLDGDPPLTDEANGIGAAEFGRMPIPVWEIQMQVRLAQLQAQLSAAFAPVKNPDGSTSPGTGVPMSDQTSPALPAPGSEGGRRDQSQTGEPAMIDQTGKRSVDLDRLASRISPFKSNMLQKMDSLLELLEDDDEKGLKE